MLHKPLLSALITASVLLVPMSGTFAAGSGHSTLAECYDYAIAQCTDDDPDYDECINFGLDDCDGSYNLSKIGLTTKQAKRLRLGKQRSALQIWKARRARNQ